MIKNLEFTVFNPNETDKAEKFNVEFASLSYYYFLKLRKIKIASCPYIKIRIDNEKKITPVTYTPANGILFIEASFDFTHYLQLPKKEKLKFQYEMMYEILKNAFIEYKVDWKILDDINNELANNKWEMRYEWTSKKINKTHLFKLLIYMDIDAFTFVAEIWEGNKKEEVLIFKSLSGFFVIEFLFKKFQIIENKIRIGSKEKAVFEIDILRKTVTVIDKGNEYIKKLRYRENPVFV